MVKLHEKSEKLIRDVFIRYTYSETIPDKLVGKFVLHMYAEEDTYTKTGNLEGYYDALFFRLDIYDTQKLIKYSIRNRDGISIHGVAMDVRIFKDGSTILFSKVRDEFEVSISQNVYIVPRDF